MSVYNIFFLLYISGVDEDSINLIGTLIGENARQIKCKISCWWQSCLCYLMGNLNLCFQIGDFKHRQLICFHYSKFFFLVSSISKAVFNFLQIIIIVRIKKLPSLSILVQSMLSAKIKVLTQLNPEYDSGHLFRSVGKNNFSIIQCLSNLDDCVKLIKVIFLTCFIDNSISNGIHH